MKVLYPVTITSKLDECKQFYQKVFGFGVVFEASWYVQLVHKESGIEIGLMLPDLDSQPERIHGGFSGQGVIYTLEVDDITTTYKAARAKGVDIWYELTTEEWGQRHFMMEDPAGIVIDVVQQASS